MILADIKKRFPPGVSVDLADKKWRGLKVDAIVAVVTQNGITMVVYTIQIPLAPYAIQLGIAGPEPLRTDVEQLADNVLASFDGRTNW
jgi:hypothetical protein